MPPGVSNGCFSMTQEQQRYGHGRETMLVVVSIGIDANFSMSAE